MPEQTKSSRDVPQITFQLGHNNEQTAAIIYGAIRRRADGALYVDGHTLKGALHETQAVAEGAPYFDGMQTDEVTGFEAFVLLPTSFAGEEAEAWRHLSCDALHCHNMEVEQHEECPVAWFDGEELRIIICACVCHQAKRSEAGRE
jgi:endonuclease/exonuclease/phosphatase (EEP) superfamily protein YafD